MTDLSSADWFEADASNSSAPPDGWPAGMPANAVEGAARAIRGAVKRWYNHANATLTSGGSANAQTLTYTVAPSAYVSGDGYVFKAGFTNSGATTLNVNALGAKAIQSQGAALAGNEIVSGRVTIAYYDGANFQLVNSQIAGIQTGDAAGGDLSGTYPNPTVTGTQLSAPLPIAQGGSGQTTALAAFNAIVVTSSSSSHMEFSNGVIDQWGITASLGGGTSVAVTFPIAFTSNIIITLTVYGDTTPIASVGVGTVTVNGFTARTDKVTSGQIYWRAVGT